MFKSTQEVEAKRQSWRRLTSYLVCHLTAARLLPVLGTLPGWRPQALTPMALLPTDALQGLASQPARQPCESVHVASVTRKSHC